MKLLGLLEEKTNFHSDYYDLVTFAKKKIKSIYTKDINSTKFILGLKNVILTLFFVLMEPIIRKNY